ncbi:MAG: UMP kinase [Rhabdochlamydiaceae bacterium]
MLSKMPNFRRILIKISGEALMGQQKFGIDPLICREICLSLKALQELNIEVAVVVGGGNIFRGLQSQTLGFERVASDQIGMLATCMNGLVLDQTLKSLGSFSQVMSGISCASFLPPFEKRSALEHLKNKDILIFTGGTGNPFFTTDTAAALRACEIEADVLFKATKVNGIYNKDPKEFKDAVRYSSLTYSDVLTRKLAVMDAAAISLCRENHIPIIVFDLLEKDSLLKAAQKEPIGTLVTGE